MDRKFGGYFLKGHLEDQKEDQKKPKKEPLFLIEGHLNGIDGLSRFMSLILKTRKPAFTIRQRKNQRLPGGYVKASALADHFSSLNFYAGIFCTEWAFSPELHHFFAVYRQHPIKDCMRRVPNARINDGRYEAEIFNEFIEHLRTTAKHIDLKRKIRHWYRQSENNRKSLQRFQVEMFERYARLLVIRLDLYYKAAKFDSNEIRAIVLDNAESYAKDQIQYWESSELLEPRLVVARVSLEEVLRDKDHLFANRRGNRKLFEHLVGYVWCAEFTPKAGYHLHTALMFNGAQVQNHEWFAMEIGKYWTEVVTQGRGYFNSSNRDREKYGDHWALGLVDHWDIPKRANLARALAYFVKDEQRVRVKPHRKCRTFGAVIVNRKQSPRTGRPRHRAPEALAATAGKTYRENFLFYVNQLDASLT